ncbi:MAG: hypothetical protein JXR63_12850 [Spirochaetales bacterium]|nr:hypothetical protein [Spirochaetales bacterium]
MKYKISIILFVFFTLFTFSCKDNSVVVSKGMVDASTSKIFPVYYQKIITNGKAMLKEATLTEDGVLLSINVVGYADLKNLLADLNVYCKLVFDEEKKLLYLGEFVADSSVTNLHFRYEKAFLKEFLDELELKAKAFPVVELKKSENYQDLKGLVPSAIDLKEDSLVVKFAKKK